MTDEDETSSLMHRHCPSLVLEQDINLILNFKVKSLMRKILYTSLFITYLTVSSAVISAHDETTQCKMPLKMPQYVITYLLLGATLLTNTAFAFKIAWQRQKLKQLSLFWDLCHYQVLWYTLAGPFAFFTLIALFTMFEPACLEGWDQIWLFCNYCICALVALPPGVVWNWMVMPSSDISHMLFIPSNLGSSTDTGKATVSLEPTILDHESECSICLRVITPQQWGVQLPCSHTFHNDCIQKWA
jgi:hypothetical protein